MKSRGFEQVCTSDEARAYFKGKGLTYADITEGAILILTMLLQKELKKSNKAGETSVSSMTLSTKVDMKKKTTGSIIWCRLYMNAHYFTRREAISFNEDGFIGFAWWADVGNKNPLLRAFLRWCDYLAETNKPLELVRHGRWERADTERGPYLRCSECHFDGLGGQAQVFCPHCGVKMTKEKVT